MSTPLNTSDYIGKKYGKLTVISALPEKSKRAMVICKCDCGVTVETSVNNLKTGNSKSCGCTRIGKVALLSYTHGLSQTRLHRIWRSMKSRCYNSNVKHYPNYGGRGITICEEWRNDFKTFYDWAMANGYSDDLTIDRKENDEGYSPDNCRWATSSQQASNRRSRTK